MFTISTNPKRHPKRDRRSKSEIQQSFVKLLVHKYAYNLFARDSSNFKPDRYRNRIGFQILAGINGMYKKF